jgi:cytochrome d ubiquinol oxidase subunit I
MQAAEGFWDAQSVSPAPYLWLIIPDQKGQSNRFEFGTPRLGSIWLTHSLDGRVEGLKNTPMPDQPYMGLVFYGFRVMYVIAIAMFTLAGVSLWLRWRRKLFSTRWFLIALVWMTPSGIFATLGGWYLAETGRQPYVIYGLLRTVDAVSPVPAGTLLTSLIAFIVIYSIFFTAFLVFLIRAMRRGPNESVEIPVPSGSLKRALRPKIIGPALGEKPNG